MPKSIFSATPGFLFFGASFIILGIYGSINRTHTLLVAVILAAILLIADLLIHKFDVNLISVWALAFSYLYLSEWFSLRVSVYDYFSQTGVATAEGYISAAFGFSIIGYGIATIFLKNRDPETKISALSFEKTAMPGIYLLYVVVYGLFIWWFVFIAIGSENLIGSARISRDTSIELSSVMRQVATVATILFPILVYYNVVRFRTNAYFLIFMSVGVISALLFISTNGTRYFIGYLAAGILFFITKGFRQQNQRTILFIAFCLFSMLFTQRFIRVMRAEGIANVAISDFIDIAGDLSNLLSAENLLFYNTLAIENEYYTEDLPLENLFITYWWIPRSIWPDKPTQYGHWMPRQAGLVSSTSTHSVAGGFSMPALIDFGPIFGAMFCMVYGAFIAALERYTVYVSTRDDLSTVVASTFYFSVFFMMRSLHLGIINISLFAALLLVPNMLIQLYQKRNQQKLVPKPILQKSFRSSAH